MNAKLTDIRRATDRLKGIMLGIVIDGRVQDDEIDALNDWLEMHANLLGKEPFRSVYATLRDVLDDGFIDDEERDEIAELCWTFDDDSYALDVSTNVMGALHGILQGIASDGIITNNEVLGLKNWLLAHNLLKDYWPVCEAWDLVSKALVDGVIDDYEKDEILSFCKEFSERPVHRPILKDEIYNSRFMINGAPVLHPVTSICDREHRICFDDKCFCFTGPAVYGKRKDLHNLVVELGGIPKTSVSIALDYLVIGAQSSPAWAFSTYGRKIEKAMNLNDDKDASIAIIFEDDFVSQAKNTF